MREEKNTIENYAIYSDNEKHRYILERVWDKAKPIPLFISKRSGTANGIYLELTNSLITNNLYKLGYGGYYSANLCSGIHGKTTELADSETDRYITEYAKKSSEIIISWGTLTKNDMKEREREVLKLLKGIKKKVLAVADGNGKENVHVLTPSIRNGFELTEVNVKELLNIASEKTVKTEKGGAAWNTGKNIGNAVTNKDINGACQNILDGINQLKGDLD